MNLKKIGIIDYRMGNLFSVKHACKYVGLESEIISKPENIYECDAAILPGVGAFGQAMQNLNDLELIGPITDFINSGKPFMGICLGFQLLMKSSEEFGQTDGFGIIEGAVKKFPSENEGQLVKVPQIGWNKIQFNQRQDFVKKSPLRTLNDQQHMYFVHSYYVEAFDESVVLTTSDYAGINYCSSIFTDNVFATQFHPEKSGENGIEIYKEWAKIIK